MTKALAAIDIAPTPSLVGRKKLPNTRTAIRVCHISSLQTDFDARIFHRQCIPLAEMGMEVSFVGPHPGDRSTNGMKVIATPRRRNRFTRMVSTFLLLPKALRTRADFYFLNDPELLPVGIALKLLCRGKVVYDSREDYPDMMMHKKYLPRFCRPVAAWMLAALEQGCSSMFDGIMTADAATMRRMATVSGSKKLVLYNFPSLQLFSLPPTRKIYDFVYRGGLSDRAGTWVLLDALSILRSEGCNTKTLIIGYADSPASWDQIAKRIEDLGLKDSIELSARISHSKMPEMLARARIGICPLLAVPKFLRNIPVKIFEYWASGLPVIASDLGPIRPFFKQHVHGSLVPPGDSRILAEAMRQMLEHPEEAARMGQLGREAVVQRLNSESELSKLTRFIARMA
jgi:glycosyltransferase involved in cell wall biosynthesis